MRGVNKCITDKPDEFALYLSGKSIPEVYEETGIPLSTLRHRFKKAGILRSRADGVRMAHSKGRVPSRKGISRTFTQEWCDNISKAKRLIGEHHSSGINVSKGYPRFTRGVHKGQFVHKVVMEIWLGRALDSSECVHHIDGDRKNNDIDNLCLMTPSGHAKLHRYQDQLAGNLRQRNERGEFA